jgi:hypothetical protein
MPPSPGERRQATVSDCQTPGIDAWPRRISQGGNQLNRPVATSIKLCLLEEG